MTPPKGSGVVEYRLPAWNKVKVDIKHIMDNHTEGGTGGPQKDKFPKGTTAAMIAKLVEEAYKHAEKMGSLQHSWEEGVEHVTQFFQGSAGGQTIQFWFDYTTNTIRTAWPK